VIEERSMVKTELNIKCDLVNTEKATHGDGFF
jgi:hypothetical protein